MRSRGHAVSEREKQGGGATMEGDQLKSESRPVVSRPRSGPLDGKRPAVQDTLSHALSGVSATSADESEIRHHERQLCAAEMVILAMRSATPEARLALMGSAALVARREVRA